MLLNPPGIMDFIDIPTEQTTAVTDLINFFLAIGLGILISRWRNPRDEGRSRYWSLIFFLLGFASGLGFLAHGFEMSDTLRRIIWMPLNLSLGLAISCFLIIVILELWGPKTSAKAYPVLIGIGCGFFTVTLLIPGTFILFIIFMGITMILAFAAYIYLSVTRKHFHYKLITGIITTAFLCSFLFMIIHAIGDLQVKIIWEFDQNSFFHVLMSFAMIVLTFGIRSQLNLLLMDITSEK